MNNQLFSSLLSKIKGINLSGIINTTNKTLTTVKKAIPVYKEVRPYFRKEKSLFKKEEEDIIGDRPIKVKKEIDNNITFFN